MKRPYLKPETEREFGPVHYGMTQDEARSRYQTSGDFEGPQPLCGNGNFHCNVTRNKSKVTCEACQARL